jgi:hypothetical protein
MLLIGIAALIGGIYWQTESSDAPHHTYWYWWHELVLALGGFPSTSVDDTANSPVRAATETVVVLLALILPALVLGIIVFKAFVAKAVFRLRSRLALEKYPSSINGTDYPYRLAIRLYSATRLEIVKVKFDAYIRIEGISANNSPTVTNHRLLLAKETWPVALTHVPYTLIMPLQDADVSQHPDNGLKLIAAQGKRVGALSKLVLQIAGYLPALNAPFIETHWFTLNADISSEKYGDVDVDYDKPYKSWTGWGEFEART